jgi:hypothetical protein
MFQDTNAEGRERKEGMNSKYKVKKVVMYQVDQIKRI